MYAFARRCAARNIRILTYEDPDYPLALTRIPDMPLVLYCTGDPLWLNEPGAVGIVGSRKPTEYGLNAAADIGGELAQSGALIVSGLADGLDSAGHRAAVKNNCPTIAVMGVPIDRTYPAANVVLRHKIEQKGCVISEYPPRSEGVGPNGFLQRNRLIAALSSALLVVEAQEKSGTMSTVSHAERYGKPVFAVPGSIYSPNSAGTNGLLRDGRARAVCSAADLLGPLGLRRQSAAAAQAEADAEQQRWRTEFEASRKDAADNLALAYAKLEASNRKSAGKGKSGTTDDIGETTETVSGPVSGNALLGTNGLPSYSDIRRTILTYMGQGNAASAQNVVNRYWKNMSAEQQNELSGLFGG